ncbi:MAG: hypothetical protein U0793_33465 [Gemmataceae bacterium]
MISYVNCPACHNTVKVEEGQMGKRLTCPRCNSPFLASQPAGAAVPAGATPLNKTMLGEIEPPIHYSCPRCKKPLEDPASEAGTKKPCPHCGQRVQVPAAAPAAAPAPLNKTMLGQTEPGQTEPELPLAKAVPDAPARQERCLECGRDVTGWENLFTCPDCGSTFCSSGCIRNHRYHAHEPPRPRERRPRPAPEPEPEADYTGLIVGLVLGGFFLIIFVVVIVMVAASSSRW